ncbi:MAG: tetratricopeptide repeat protein, partial [Acidobacteria bacterium]|nr:tetratricopeptide repeat protein [Acidobacteriota bacterium]
MKKFAFLIFCSVCLFVNVSTSAQSRIPITWEVQKYDIGAVLPQNFYSDRDLDVTAALDLKNVSSGAFSRLTLRISDQAVVSAVSVNGASADFSKGEESIGGSQKLQRVVVSLPSMAPNTTFSVKVTYKLKVPSNTGLNSLSSIDSQFLPMSFWYPTPNSWFFSGGADFAPFSLRVTGGKGATLVSSGTNAGGSYTQSLNAQPFFLAGVFETSDINGVEVFMPSGTGPLGKERANELAGFFSEANAFVAKMSGSTKKVPLRIVAVNRGAGFSDSGTVLVDDSVFRRQKLDSQTAMLLAEAAAKTWLGNMVEVSGDGYGVIREGLSRFIATQFIEAKFGKEVADIERLRQRTNYAAIASRDSPLNIVSPIDGYYFTATANKGSMIWKFLSLNLKDAFWERLRTQAADGNLTIGELRDSFSEHKAYLDYMIDNSTAMNLMVGVPQNSGNQTKVALRNISDIAAQVDVVGTTASGQRLVTSANLNPNGFGEAVFRSPEKVVRAEVDPEKIYPQTNYSDDVAPRDLDDNDPILFIKKEFDRQRYEDAEKNAKIVLRAYPILDEAQTFLGRALLAQNKVTEAARIFQQVLDDKLPTPQSLAWANVGLGELALKTGDSAGAMKYFDQTIRTDGDYGASLAARIGRSKLNPPISADQAIISYFKDFDAAVLAHDKARVDSLVGAGEVSRFASGVAGQAEQWATQVLRTDSIDSDNVLVETNLNVRLLNREVESGMAVFRLSKLDGV